jgi:multiple sugar transport system permease protein
MRDRRREAATAYLFIAPAMLLFAAFVFVPAVSALGLSFFEWDLVGSPTFIGLDNFVRIAEDPVARKAMGNTAIFTMASVVLHVVGGLGLAVGANLAMPGVIRYFLRTAFFVPVVLSWAAVATIWSFLMDPDMGLFNYFLGKLGLDAPNWLVTPGWAMVAIIIVDFWHTVGFSFIICLAGLQSISTDLYEAAQIDGAGKARQFWHVTLPGLSPTLLFVTIISFLAAAQVFDPVYIMTRGGPEDSTLSMVMHIFNQGFRQYEMGYASALSVLMLAVLMLATAFQLRLSRRWVTYDG